MKDYPPQVIRLGNELADRLADRQSLQLYLHFAEKYKEEHLMKILDKVLAIPDRKIKKM